MNDTKRMLIKFSAIFGIIDSIAYFITAINIFLNVGYFGDTKTGSGNIQGFFNFSELDFFILAGSLIVLGVFSLVGAVLLFISISDPVLFSQKKGIYISGCIFNIIGGTLLSLSNIFLYISFAFKTVNNGSEEEFDPHKQNDSNDSLQLKEKIENLRKLKDNGEISEQEFTKKLFEILNKN